jgi:hypothetical protein
MVVFKLRLADSLYDASARTKMTKIKWYAKVDRKYLQDQRKSKRASNPEARGHAGDI